MDTRDQFVVQVIGEKARAQHLAAAWCGLACGLQQLLDGAGGSGLPPLRAELPLEALAVLQAQLDARLVPPVPTPNGAE